MVFGLSWWYKQVMCLVLTFEVFPSLQSLNVYQSKENVRNVCQSRPNDTQTMKKNRVQLLEFVKCLHIFYSYSVCWFFSIINTKSDTVLSIRNKEYIYKKSLPFCKSSAQALFSWRFWSVFALAIVYRFYFWKQNWDELFKSN